MSQGELRKGHGADSRLAEAADRLRNRIEAHKREGGTRSAAVSRTEDIRQIESAEAEAYAKETGLWIPIEDTFRWKRVSGGNENEVFLSDNHQIYKINNLMNDGGILSLLERILLHNLYFPETAYQLIGFTGIDGRSVFPILAQAHIEAIDEASPEEIDMYFTKLGFQKIGDYSYTNGEVTIDDLRPRNVLKDANGTFYIIDAGLKRNL